MRSAQSGHAGAGKLLPGPALRSQTCSQAATLAALVLGLLPQVARAAAAGPAARLTVGDAGAEAAHFCGAGAPEVPVQLHVPRPLLLPPLQLFLAGGAGLCAALDLRQGSGQQHISHLQQWLIGRQDQTASQIAVAYQALGDGAFLLNIYISTQLGCRTGRLPESM
jgi:hypothetical protein